MSVRTTLVVLALLACCGVCHGMEQRWGNFAEDGDLRYFLDRKSVVSLPDNIYIFWVKSIAKDSRFFKNEYNLDDISYVLTNYELDCAVSSFRVRGTVMFDRNRREISKILPVAGDVPFEPIQPETMLELAQEEICSGSGKSAASAEMEERGATTVASKGGTGSAAPAQQQAPVVSPEPPGLGETLAAPEQGNPFDPALPPTPDLKSAPAAPSAPAAQYEPAAPEAPR